MIDRHGDQRGAAGDVDGVDAPFGSMLVRHVRFQCGDMTVSIQEMSGEAIPVSRSLL